MDARRQQYLEDYLKKVGRYKIIGRYRGSPVVSLYQPPLASPAGERSLGLRLRRRFDHERLPAVATLAVNRACQCECAHCSAIYYNHSSKPDLTTAEMKQALKETVELGVTNVILLGGEPLLRPDLIELIESVPKDKAVVTMFTNGEFLNLETCRRLADAGLMGVFVSLDSTDPKEHDRLRRRPGLFQKVSEGIRNLKSVGLLTAISSYLNAPRLRKGVFEAMMELGREWEVNEVTFFDAIPTGRWLHETSGLLKPKDREKIKLLVRFYRRRKDYPGISAQSTMTSEQGSAFCFAANTQFYLTAHGEMCPCDFTPLTVGRFPEENIETLWKKMISTPPYDCRAKSCRMQNPEFRSLWIDRLPLEGELPSPLVNTAR